MWLYKKNSSNTARFILGEKGERSLICFGINSSTAEPDKLDRTVSRVYSVAQKGGFDGWIMLNLYPQRATNFNNVHKTLDEKLHNENLKYIKKVLRDHSKSTVWAAWGNLIEGRPFLKECLKDILGTVEHRLWVHKGSLTAQGHPRHPLYLRSDAPFHPFDMNKYLRISC